MKVGDRVKLTKDTIRVLNTNFTTGVVIEMPVDAFLIRVKRDGYRGHENTVWHKSWWRKY